MLALYIAVRKHVGASLDERYSGPWIMCMIAAFLGRKQPRPDAASDEEGPSLKNGKWSGKMPAVSVSRRTAAVLIMNHGNILRISDAT